MQRNDAERGARASEEFQSEGVCDAHMQETECGGAWGPTVEEIAEDYRRAAETASEAEKRFHLFLDNAEDMVYFRSVDGTIMTLNAACEKITGFSREAFQQDPGLFCRLIHRDDLASWNPQLSDAQEDSESRVAEYRLRHGDGTWRWIQSRMAACRTAAGAFIGYNCIDRDVTAWKQAERALRKREAELLRAQRLARLGNWHYDVAERTAWWSPELHRIAGFDPGGAPPRYAAIRRLLPRDECRRLTAKLREALTQGTGFGIELHITPKSQEARVLVMLCEALRGPDDCVEALAGTVQDVTHERTAEEERRIFERQMHQAQKLESLGLLANGIAHDFNNLLMSVLGTADLLRAQLPAESSARGAIDEVILGAQRAADLARQMLVYAGEGPNTVEPIDLHAIVREMGHLLDASIGNDITLIYDFSSDLPRIEADATQMRQLILNLITNASEAIGAAQGEITVGTEARHFKARELCRRCFPAPLPPGFYVCLSVGDTGCGISEEIAQRLFDPFFTTKLTGRGLGLATVLGTAKGHGGAVIVDSSPGRGTTFRILLPAEDRPAAAAPLQEESQNPWLGGGKVLLVEDEPTVRAVASRMLEHLGMEITEACDGVEALGCLEQAGQSFDCVLLDWSMPRLDGPEMLMRVRSLVPDLPVVICSGYNEDIVNAQLHGPSAEAFLQKPYCLSSLGNALREALSVR